MTEYIPRDTPIYCFFNPESERDVARVQQTRDIWQKRWGYTNFILQRRVHTLQALDSIMTPSYIEGLHFELIKPGMESYWPEAGHILHYAINFLYLIKKLRTRPGPSIIIQSNTLLKNDIELKHYENDITFFALQGSVLIGDTISNKQQRAQVVQLKVRPTSGLMVSQEWVKAAYSNQIKSFDNPYFSSQVAALQGLSKKMVQSPTDFTQMMPGCKHNIDELKFKPEEEYYGFTVPN